MPKKSAKKKTAKKAAAKKPKRKYLSQSDVPNNSLSQALRVPTAIVENYGSDPSAPVEVAEAIDMTPTSGTFRNLCGASIAYGLTTGGYNATEIATTDLADKILKPQEEGADLEGKREALLTPKIIREFLEKYDGNQLPKATIANNVLEKMGVPPNRVDDVHDLIVSEATQLGLIREIKGKRFVHLKGSKPPAPPADEEEEDASDLPEEDSTEHEEEEIGTGGGTIEPPAPLKAPAANNRVFVTHGKNRDLIGPIKRLLEFGQLEPVVSVEKQSISKPIPDKVMDDMRSCSAAIIHVDDELRLMDSKTNEHVVLNPNVLIEIGAAMGLYGRSFILLVKEGTTLPSNLQGLFEVRYSGDTLDGDATIRLMEAINELKKHAEESK